MASYMIFILHIYTDVFLESPDSKILDGWSERFRELTMFLYQKSGQTILASCNVPKKVCRYIFIYIDIYVSRFTYLDSDTTFLMFSVFPLHEVVNFAIVFANPRGQWKGNICCLSHLFVSWFWQACLRVTANKTHKISIKISETRDSKLSRQNGLLFKRLFRDVDFNLNHVFRCEGSTSTKHFSCQVFNLNLHTV